MWQAVKFTRPNGQPITEIEHVVEAMTTSAIQSPDKTELHGIILEERDENDRHLVVCYTGNGPNSEKRAKQIVDSMNALKALVEKLDYSDFKHQIPTEFAAAKAALGVCQTERGSGND